MWHTAALWYATTPGGKPLNHHRSLSMPIPPMPEGPALYHDAVSTQSGNNCFAEAVHYLI